MSKLNISVPLITNSLQKTKLQPFSTFAVLRLVKILKLKFSTSTESKKLKKNFKKGDWKTNYSNKFVLVSLYGN